MNFIKLWAGVSSLIFAFFTALSVLSLIAISFVTWDWVHLPAMLFSSGFVAFLRGVLVFSIVFGGIIAVNEGE